MRFPKLRVAWSGGCGAAAVLLCVLWVRSYRQMDWILLHCESYSVAATSLTGVINFSAHGREVPHWDFYVRSHPILPEDVGRFGALTFLWNTDISSRVLVLPHWFLAPILVLGAASFPPRFSLRTLLVAITLVAMLLGLAVWVAH